MNRDEIMNMQPGRELDALVAEKVFGLIVDGETTEESLNNGHLAFGILICYSTLISAAWEVVEKFPIVQIEHIEIYEGHKSVNVLIPRVHIDGAIEVEFQTAPEAICKAALMALIQEDTP